MPDEILINIVLPFGEVKTLMVNPKGTVEDMEKKMFKTLGIWPNFIYHNDTMLMQPDKLKKYGITEGSTLKFPPGDKLPP